MGNDMISRLSINGKYKLKFDLESRKNGKWYYAEYKAFVVLSEHYNYKLLVSGYSGNAGGDSFGIWHNGRCSPRMTVTTTCGTRETAQLRGEVDSGTGVATIVQ